MSIRLRDGAERDLSDLRPTTHDDDPLAVDPRHRRGGIDGVNAVELPELCDDVLKRMIHRELQDNLRLLAMGNEVDVRNLGAPIRKYFGQSEENPWPVRGQHRNRVGMHQWSDQ